jgi:hypothetical protein
MSDDAFLGFRISFLRNCILFAGLSYLVCLGRLADFCGTFIALGCRILGFVALGSI